LITIINQKGEEFSRLGIYRICKKYLSMALPPNPKRLKLINPVCSKLLIPEAKNKFSKFGRFQGWQIHYNEIIE
jgi:hypothetical protein